MQIHYEHIWAQEDPLLNFVNDIQYGTLCGTTHMAPWHELVDSWAKFRWNKLGQCLSLMNVTRLLVVIYPSSWKVANSRMVRIDIRKRTNTYLVLLSETSVNLGVNELRNSARHHPQSLLEVFDIFLDMNYSCVEKCWHINCIIHTMWILCCYFLIH